MRRTLFWFGWAVLLALPVLYGVQVYVIQDLLKMESWKWLALLGAALLYTLPDTSGRTLDA